MEALTDFNLFGSSGGPNSIIHVHPDNIQHCNVFISLNLFYKDNVGINVTKRIIIKSIK